MMTKATVASRTEGGWLAAARSAYRHAHRGRWVGIISLAAVRGGMPSSSVLTILRDQRRACREPEHVQQHPQAHADAASARQSEDGSTDSFEPPSLDLLQPFSERRQAEWVTFHSRAAGPPHSHRPAARAPANTVPVRSLQVLLQAGG